ncbi:MAG: sulfatase-like hydrolase/transferase, partial [Maribacter sp.]
AEALKEQGYYNLFVGKWHLGQEEYHPIHQGFDKQIGTSNFGHPASYYPPYFYNSDVLTDEKSRYLTDKLTDESIRFIETYDKNKPFMLSFWYYSVHSPHEGRKDLVEHFEAKGLEEKYAHYAAMVKAVDESVERVMEAVKKKGIEKETIVIFLSDQGGYFENKPFRGGKISETLFEGGARVPFFFYWPGVTNPNTKNNSVVQSTDLFLTLVELVGGEVSNYKNLDGVSLLSTITSNTFLKRDAIFGYRAYEDLYASVRDGDWKLLAYRNGKLQLYNIAEDIKEQKNLTDEKPAKLKELVAKLLQWEKEMGVEKFTGVVKNRYDSSVIWELLHL